MPRRKKMYFEPRRRRSPVEEDGSFEVMPGFVFDPDGFFIRKTVSPRRAKPKPKPKK